MGTTVAASGDDIRLADILTPPTCEIFCSYKVNVNYVNTNTFDDENNVSLNFLDDIVDQVGNRIDGQAVVGHQCQTFDMDTDFKLRRKIDVEYV